MALPDSLKRTIPSSGDRFIFAHAADWACGAGETDWGAQEADAEIDFTDVASGAAEQSSSATLPTNQDLEWEVWLVLEFATAPVSGESVDVYKGSSPASGVWPGGMSGSSAAYTGTAGDILDDSLKQLDYVGSMICTADATTVVQVQLVGILPAQTMAEIAFVVDNNTSDAMHSDAVEMAIVLIGRVIQIQD